ncbi:hypothetical protein HaLaN_06806 [Haematococcus lacustris]|uniref:Uncharacterized protein n=1 Tax=Haematococcus lacustris TaxID=44745 RepID=A0A699YWV3_HAELA|nr:hypothetical protein HaLaN_06806 [Haematococcus lacustris]
MQVPIYASNLSYSACRPGTYFTLVSSHPLQQLSGQSDSSCSLPALRWQLARRIFWRVTCDVLYLNGPLAILGVSKQSKGAPCHATPAMAPIWPAVCLLLCSYLIALVQAGAFEDCSIAEWVSGPSPKLDGRSARRAGAGSDTGDRAPKLLSGRRAHRKLRGVTSRVTSQARTLWPCTTAIGAYTALPRLHPARPSLAARSLGRTSRFGCAHFSVDV